MQTNQSFRFQYRICIFADRRNRYTELIVRAIAQIHLINLYLHNTLAEGNHPNKNSLESNLNLIQEVSLSTLSAFYSSLMRYP